MRIASLIAYLRTCLRLPVRLIQEYLRTRHDLVISTEEIVDLLHRVAQADKVQQAAQVINERVRKSAVVHDPWQGSTPAPLLRKEKFGDIPKPWQHLPPAPLFAYYLPSIWPHSS